MTWRPSAAVEPALQLDGFRSTAAVVMDGDRLVVRLVCEVEPFYVLTGGHLWWRRWAGKEVVHGYESDGDWHEDWVSDPDHPVGAVFLRDLLAGWYRERNYDATGYVDDQDAPIVSEYRVRWLVDPERSAVLADLGF